MGWGLVALVLLTAVPLAAETKGEPILVIDSGGHTSVIQEVIFTPDGRHLVSAADDKVLRVWDIGTGRTVRTIRGPIGPGHEGKIFGAALSPDGRILAVGGWLPGDRSEAYAIRLHDFRAGEILGLLVGHENPVFDLAFSPDGGRLASGSADHKVLLWERNGEAGVWKTALVLEGHEDGVVDVAFSPDGERVASGSLDRTARLWDVGTGRLVRELSDHADTVEAVAFSPDGWFLATGSGDGTVRLWDARTGEEKGILVHQEGAVTHLVFSPQGDLILAGFRHGRWTWQALEVPSGEVRFEFSQYDVVFADASTRDGRLLATEAFFPVSNYYGLAAMACSPDGRLVATSAGSRHAIDLSDLVLFSTPAGSMDDDARQTLVGDGRPVWGVAFSRDGRSLAFCQTLDCGNTDRRHPLERVLHLRPAEDGFEVGLGGAVEEGFERARTEVGDLRLETPSGDIDPILRLLRGDEVLHEWERERASGYDHLSFALGPGGRWVVSGGSSGTLTIYNAATGETNHELVGHTGDVWSVAVSPDGRLVASGSADQTIRLWDPASGRLLVSVFVGRDDEWVAWTPEGYYTASPDGERYIGWHVNQGVDRQAGYYPVEQFRRQYYWSDVVNKTLELRDPVLAFREARMRAPIGAERPVVERPELPPQIFFVAPEDGATVTRATQSVRVRAVSTGSPLTDLTISVGGRVINKLEGRPKGDPRRRDEEVEIELARGRNVITAAATTERSQADESITVIYDPPAESTTERVGPRLAVLAVGVSDYALPSLQLEYAGDDARDLAARFKTQAGRAFSGVAVTVLLDAEVTRLSVLNGLAWLREETPNAGDVRLLFLSGHGAVDGRGDFYFLTHGHRDGPDLDAFDLSWLTLLRRLTEGEATAVLMADVCHAGGVIGPAAGRAPTDFTDLLKEVNARATNLITFAASTARQVSVERDEWRNGAFTEAILAGLRPGGADGYVGGREDGAVIVQELGAFVTDWVRRATAGAQVPTVQPSPGLEILQLFELP